MIDKRTARAISKLQAELGAGPQVPMVGALPPRAMLVAPVAAWMLVTHGKDLGGIVGTAGRRWPRYVGRIAIYAGARMSRWDYEETRRQVERLGLECPMPLDIARGYIVGTMGLRITHGGEPKPCEPVSVKLNGSGLWVPHQRATKPARWMRAPRQLDMIDWLDALNGPQQCAGEPLAAF